MAPTSPYSTASQAAMLLKAMFRGATPGAATPVTSSEFTTLISWVDSVIDSYFQSVGYKIPFVALTGETWPTAQTTLLGYMSALGAAAMAGGHILNPAPSMVPIRSGGGDQHPYSIAIDKSLKMITETGYHFRADYYLGTKAERWLSQPYGPWSDFMIDYVDPTRYLLVRDYTEMIDELFGDIGAVDIDWDYLWNKRDGKFDA